MFPPLHPPTPIRDASRRERRLPEAFLWACRRLDVRLTRDLLVVNIPRQRLHWFEVCENPEGDWCGEFRKSFLISSSRYGTGQVEGSNRTPLGLHRIAKKVGAGWPVGTVFKGRKPIGHTWAGMPDAPIAHRILWLEGLQPGFNRGGRVDSFARYIYIHGLGDEPSLGRPASIGCIHMAARDLMPLFDWLETGTLVWVSDDAAACS